jgi:hypothetical protein
VVLVRLPPLNLRVSDDYSLLADETTALAVVTTGVNVALGRETFYDLGSA